MARKHRIGETPAGVPNHTIKVNNKNVGIMEDYASVKAYGTSVYVNDRYVAESTSMLIRVRLPRDVRMGRVRASHGAWIEVSYV